MASVIYKQVIMNDGTTTGFEPCDVVKRRDMSKAAVLRAVSDNNALANKYLAQPCHDNHVHKVFYQFKAVSDVKFEKYMQPLYVNPVFGDMCVTYDIITHYCYAKNPLTTEVKTYARGNWHIVNCEPVGKVTFKW